MHPTGDAGDPVAPRRSLARALALVERGHEATVLVDASARPLWFSPEAERLLGRRLEDGTGGEPLRALHPDDRPGTLAAFANVVADARSLPSFRARIVRPDGEVRTVEAAATNLLDDPEVGAVVLHLRDVTDRLEPRSPVEVTESRYRRMLENISDTVTLLAADGSVIDTTGNVKSILGYAEEFWRQRNAFDLVHPADADRVRRLLVHVLEHPGEPVTDELRVRHADGHYEVVEGTAVSLLEVHDVRAIVLTTRNITARKRVERELAEARDAAVRALHERTAFVAGVSHELRTPIHGILGLGELLLAADLPADAAELVGVIVRATESLRVVIDDILDLAKIEAGRIELHVQPVRLDEVVRDLEALFRPQAVGRGIALEATASPALPARLVTDGFRLRQVLTNLLGNAVKFTDAGSVTLDVTPVGATDDPRVRFTVRDTGIGIAADALDRIFEPFAQGAAATDGRRGTGLGLAISRQLVERLGGRLEVHSDLGVGSAFSFDLPLVLAEVSELGDDEVGTLPAGTVVLVAEDNPVNQLLVQRQLERLGCEVVVVADAQAVLPALAGRRIDAVLLDAQLGDADGSDVTRAVRTAEAEASRPRTPIVALTAAAMPADRARCLDAGMDDVLTKPASLASLARVLAGVLADASPPEGALALSASAMATVDPSVLDRLAVELDDPRPVVNVVRSYLRELGPRLAAMDDAFRRGDREGLQSVAHTLTSTSAAVGAVGLRDAVRAVEDRCRAGASLAPIGPALVVLRAAAATVTDALEAAMVRLAQS